jgi:predicted TIM-barrel fold metal-dependent hydrolase
MKIIDPHLHFFDLAKGQYDWLKADRAPFWPDKAIIARNSSQSELVLPCELELAGFVHIEAGFDNNQPWREIAWLEQTNSLPFKSVACVDLTANRIDFANTLAKLQHFSSLVGVRHLLDQQACALLTDPLVVANLAELAASDLLFEAQLNGDDSQGMLALQQVAQALPQLTVIINHCGFSPKAGSAHQLWQHNIATLAQYPNVYIKASGWEMVDRAYSGEHVTDVLTFLTSQFCRDKVMLASNFPLCLFSESYGGLWGKYRKLAVSPDTLQRLMFGNSHSVYRF